MSIIFLVVIGIFGFALPLSSQSETTVLDWFPQRLVSQVLEGSAYLPPFFSGSQLYFSADDRRLYSFDLQRFSASVLPRRTLGPIETLDPITRGLGILELSDGSGLLLGPEGILSRQLPPDVFDQIGTLLGRRGFPFAPGGFRVISNHRLEALDFQDRPIFSFDFPPQVRILGWDVLDDRHIFVDLESSGVESTVLLHFTLGGTRAGSLSPAELPMTFFDPRVSDYRVYQWDVVLRRDEIPLGVLIPRSALNSEISLPSGILFASPSSRQIVFRTFDGVQVGQVLNLSRHMPDFRSCHLGTNGYLVCSSTQWQLEVYRFSPELWNFDSATESDLLTKTFFNPGQGSLNPFLLEVLRDPTLFGSYLNSLTVLDPSEITQEQRIVLYRILYHSILDGEVIDRAIRMRALELFLSSSVPREAWFSVAQMLRYEYDPLLGIRVLELLASDYWSIFPVYRQSILLFLSHSVNLLDEGLITRLLQIEEEVGRYLSESTLEGLFPFSFWQRVAAEYPTPKVRQIIGDRRR
ncbi:MAG: hypothetical protein GW949_10550 [Spirochaetales bacterium]|nr:hypothetical protein [Spirochaetales bacterium]